METGAVVLIVVGVLTAIAVGRHKFSLRDRRFEVWSDVGDRLGLRIEGRFPLELGGRILDVAVRVVHTRASKDGKDGATIIGVVGRRFPFELRSGDAESLLGMLGARGVELGHERFDDRYRLVGDEKAIFALLSIGIRMRLLEYGAAIVSGEVIRRIAHDPTEEQLAGAIAELVKLVNDLRAEEAQLETRLLATILEETMPITKRRQLQTLFRIVTDPEIRERAAELALECDDPPSKLLGALYASGDRGLKALDTLARDQTMADEIRARALSRLSPPLDELLALRDGADVQMRAMIAEKMRSEGELIDALKDEAAEVRISAARSLEEVGTIDAVEALIAAGEGVFTSGELKRATTDAVRAIQARAAGAERGGLAIIGDDEQGKLSVAPEKGTLSIKSES